MRPGRLLLLLLTASPLLWGVTPERAVEPPTPFEATASITSSRAPLPAPVHDESTCPFCQAALFPPCAPASTAVLVASADLIRRAVPQPDTSVRHVVLTRSPSSRARPILRFV
ncbi:MAG TPA: hypothetical protein VHR41_11495 [Gemmatimonadales bacterium]|nr:hypothetical protein [Gemmatimonadales bacterium]